MARFVVWGGLSEHDYPDRHDYPILGIFPRELRTVVFKKLSSMKKLSVQKELTIKRQVIKVEKGQPSRAGVRPLKLCRMDLRYGTYSDRHDYPL